MRSAADLPAGPGVRLKVLIHAGIHRTGTTSLQHTLSRNRAVLAARGIRYAGETRNHQGLAWGLKKGRARVGDALALIEAGGPTEIVVLSGEDFCIHTDLAWLAAVAARHDVHAIFYLRRQDHWVMSWYNQHVKWPFARAKSQMDPQAFLATLDDFHWLDYAALLARWSDVLGPGRVAVGVVERGQVEDVVGDLLGRLGFEAALLDLASGWRNDSLPVHTLEIARHLGLFDMPAAQRRRLTAALRLGLADKAPGGARTVFSSEERRMILDRFATSNRQVAERVFGREALFLELPPPPDAAYFQLPDLSREQLLREWVAPVVAQLLKSK